MLAGYADLWNTVYIGNGLSLIPLLTAAAILAWRYARSALIVRAQTAWALAGFGSSILAQIAAIGTEFFWYSLSLDWGTGGIVTQTMLVVGNLAPLLAIYPILRHRRFDLGFVANRAALYSLLTIAALATLAAVNWFAEHFITERLATLFQPVAAIAIGLGYMRVRGWVQAVLERTIFRDRLAAEVEFERTIKGFALAERPRVLDESLTVEAANILSLQSSAVFRVRDDALARVASTGWENATLETLLRDDRLVLRLLTHDQPASLSGLGWRAIGLPEQANEPAVAILLKGGNVLVGVALYGRHVNGTEIDPEEIRLLRRLYDAAASAYRTTELQSEIVALRGRLAAMEASPAT